MPLHYAVQAYHDLLTDELAGASQAQLEDQIRRRGLFFGERPVCTVVRPRFMPSERYRFLQERGAIMLRAFHKAHVAACNDPAVRAQFRLLEWEEQLLTSDPGFREPSPTSRLDAFFTPGDGSLRFTEYNAETPAGAAYNDALSEVFLGLPIMREFLRRFDVHPLLVSHSVMHALLDAYQQWAGHRAKPRIGILDWREVPTTSEFVLFQHYFNAQGLECVIADPREVSYEGGKLRVDGAVIDLVYKRVLLSELVEREGMDTPLLRAVRDRAVCMVNPARCKLLHKKASLAVLSDERNARLFGPDEAEAIDEHVPWTRVVEERHTLHGGERVDLLPHVIARREEMVLKPNDDYGGTGIVLGWEVDDATWERSVRGALAEPFIVQERIRLPTEPYPSVVDGRVEIYDRMLDTAPFAFYGNYIAGCMTRLGTAALLNVTAGGGSSAPTFLVSRR